MTSKIDENRIQGSKTKKLTLTAMLFTVAMVLSIFENMLPPVPIPVPGVRLGLSNIVVMYALFFQDGRTALILVILKALAVLITRGVIAGIVSLLGGVFSIIIMLVLLSLFKDKISYFLLSICGAVFHNIGQFVAISIIYVGMNLWFYLPFLIILGIGAGMVTSTLMKFILPALKRLGLNNI